MNSEKVILLAITYFVVKSKGCKKKETIENLMALRGANARTNFEFLQPAPNSGAGRASPVEVEPFSFEEVRRTGSEAEGILAGREVKRKGFLAHSSKPSCLMARDCGCHSTATTRSLECPSESDDQAAMFTGSTTIASYFCMATFCDSSTEC
ncbi:hypothetical protein OIU84_024087 [Salix udensis]|uniref:Uncharacterized protein n=1 Tax=Salix udensis TaxID=889485 RepID=A0AAD6PBM2_9ROSI|nr:hypothetical protein OIU84_024087 [Salix udensis]